MADPKGTVVSNFSSNTYYFGVSVWTRQMAKMLAVTFFSP